MCVLAGLTAGRHSSAKGIFTCSWVGHLIVAGIVLRYLHQMESLVTEFFEMSLFVCLFVCVFCF